MWIKALFSLLFVGFCVGQELVYRPEPVPFLQTSAVGPIEQGNGVFLSPDQQLLVATTSGGTLQAFNPESGGLEWSYTPPNPGNNIISCSSGVTFSYATVSGVDYMIYAYVENALAANAVSRIVALSPAGMPLWTSGDIPGVISGTPLISSTGEYIFLTHNTVGATQTEGNFSVLVSLTDGLPLLYTESDSLSPFAPPGIYFQPVEGYYDGGQGLTNDVVIWSSTPRLDEEPIGTGQSYAFQLPNGFSGTDGTGLSFTVLVFDTIVDRDWKSTSAPAITNSGRSLYWSHSRNQFRCWVGVEGFDRFFFSRQASGQASFGRGRPRGLAGAATPALSSNETAPMVFAGTANPDFGFAKFSFDLATAQSVALDSLVPNRAFVSPDDLFVYYTETNGVLYQAFTEDLTNRATVPLGAEILGDFALRRDGSRLYTGTIDGSITGYQLADISSMSPSAAPSGFPTMSAPPSSTPSVVPTGMPSVVPSSTPSAMPSVSPSAMPTAMPSSSPSESPSTTPPVATPTDPPVAAPTTPPSASNALSLAVSSVLMLLGALIVG